MEKLYIIYERLSRVVQPFFGGLLERLFNYINKHLNTRTLDSDIGYSTVEILRIPKVRRVKSTLLTKKKYADLTKSLIECGYNPVKFNHITLDSDNKIIDGSKRLSILKNLHGNYLKVEVKIITFNQGKETLMARKQLLFGFLIILIILILINL